MTKRAYTFDVVGLRYRLDQAEIDSLAEAAEGEPLKGKLVREPKNEADPNAVKVMVQRRREKSWKHIGYLRKEPAAVFAQALDRGTAVVKQVRLTHVNTEHGWGSVKVVLENAVDKPKIQT
jgi:hypothetical protein